MLGSGRASIVKGSGEASRRRLVEFRGIQLRAGGHRERGADGIGRSCIGLTEEQRLRDNSAFRVRASC